MQLRRSLTSAVMAGLVALAACASDPATGQQRPEPRPAVQAPNTGVFPKPQRPVAGIISDSWSDEGARDNAGAATTVIRLLGIRPGMTVADIGAGSGYYTTRLAKVVGPAGRVYAEDIMPNYAEALSARVREAGLDNVTVVLGDADDPKLPPNAIDLALLVHMYHEIQQPYGLLHNLYPALKPGARVAIIDADRPTNEHGTPPSLLRCELAAVGYRQTEFHQLGRVEGYLAVFAPPPPGQLPAPNAIRSCAAS